MFLSGFTVLHQQSLRRVTSVCTMERITVENSRVMRPGEGEPKASTSSCENVEVGNDLVVGHVAKIGSFACQPR